MTRHALRSSVVVLVVTAIIAFAAGGCGDGDSHDHHVIPATFLVVNESPHFALFSFDDCASYATGWLAPGESIWIEIDWSVDHGHLPGTVLPCFYFQSFDGSIDGHAAYGPIWVEEGDVQTIVFG